MAKGYTTRKLEMFAIHGRRDGAPADYAALFKELADTPAEFRQQVNHDRLVAIPEMRIDNDLVYLVAYQGEPGVNPLIFNSDSAQARIEKLKKGEIVATKTHALIDIPAREVIVEYNHRGAKASDIALVLEKVPEQRELSWTLTLEFNPIADESFLKAISQFQRIRLASLRVAQPNVDWNDHYDHLTTVAADSKARLIQVEVTAHRGKTLSWDGGVVGFIRSLAQKGLSVMQQAKVTGVRESEQSETSVSLSKFVQHQKINVKLSDGHVDDQDVLRLMHRYAADRRKQRTDQ